MVDTNRDTHICAVGAKLIANYESRSPNHQIVKGVLRYFPYQGKADAKGVWTVGLGHVCSAAELAHYQKYGITEEEQLLMFASDLVKYENKVKRLRPGVTDQRLFSMLVSLVYNNGESLLYQRKSMGDALASKDRKRICAAFLPYVCSGEPPVAREGLAKRRITEAYYFYTGEFLFADEKQEAKALLTKLVALGAVSPSDKYVQRCQSLVG